VVVDPDLGELESVRIVEKMSSVAIVGEGRPAKEVSQHVHVGGHRLAE
jgi:hypothetical protein